MIFRRVLDSETHPCDNGCGVVVAPFEGIRTAGGVFCSDDCSLNQWTQRLS